MVDRREGVLGFLATLGIGALIRWAIDYVRGYFDRRAKRDSLRLSAAERREAYDAEQWELHKRRMAAAKLREKAARRRRDEEWKRIRPEPLPLDPNPYDD